MLQVHAYAMETAERLAGLTCIEGCSGDRDSPARSVLGSVPGWGCAMHVGVSVLLGKNPGLFLGFSMR